MALKPSQIETADKTINAINEFVAELPAKERDWRKIKDFLDDKFAVENMPNNTLEFNQYLVKKLRENNYVDEATVLSVSKNLSGDARQQFRTALLQTMQHDLVNVLKLHNQSTQYLRNPNNKDKNLKQFWINSQKLTTSILNNKNGSENLHNKALQEQTNACKEIATQIAKADFFDADGQFKASKTDLAAGIGPIVQEISAIEQTITKNLPILNKSKSNMKLVLDVASAMVGIGIPLQIYQKMKYGTFGFFSQTEQSNAAAGIKKSLFNAHAEESIKPLKKK